MKEKEISYLTISQLNIKRPLPNDDYSMLTWGLRDTYPRIKVYLTKNVKKEDGTTDYAKVIIAPFTFPVLYTFIDTLESLINDETPVVTKLTCFNNKFVDDKRTDEIVVQAEIKLAKSDQGVINIGIKLPTGWMYFPLEVDTTWHKFYDKNDNEITDKKILSALYAKAYVKLLRNAFAIKI